MINSTCIRRMLGGSWNLWRTAWNAPFLWHSPTQSVEFTWELKRSNCLAVILSCSVYHCSTFLFFLCVLKNASTLSSIFETHSIDSARTNGEMSAVLVHIHHFNVPGITFTSHVAWLSRWSKELNWKRCVHIKPRWAGRMFACWYKMLAASWHESRG